MAESLGAGSVRGGVKRGLCVVRDCIVEVGIVSEHGGSIEAQSEPGRGTEFCIELPASLGGELTRG